MQRTLGLGAGVAARVRERVRVGDTERRWDIGDSNADTTAAAVPTPSSVPMEAAMSTASSPSPAPMSPPMLSAVSCVNSSIAAMVRCNDACGNGANTSATQMVNHVATTAEAYHLRLLQADVVERGQQTIKVLLGRDVRLRSQDGRLRTQE